MPERIEALIMAILCHLKCAGSVVTALHFQEGRTAQGLAAFSAALPAQILRIHSRGKKVILELQSLAAPHSIVHIVTSLGMTGRWLFAERSPGHTRARLDLAAGSPIPALYFSDQRTIGGQIELALNQEELNFIMKNVGVDWFLDDFSADYFASVLLSGKYHRWAIAKFLMDQSIFAGIGNYLKAEILFACRLHPARKISTLTRDDAVRIHAWSKYIMMDVYQSGGCTLESFLTPDGSWGSYQNKLRVYGKENGFVEEDGVRYPIRDGILPATDGRHSWWAEGLQV